MTTFSYGGQSSGWADAQKAVQASERDRPDIARCRAQWQLYQGRIDPTRLVFIDETPDQVRGRLWKDEHGPAAWLGVQGQPPAGPHALRTMGHHDVFGGAAA